MRERDTKVIIGALVHDIGKPLNRYNDGRSHSKSGYEFLKDEVGITDKEILNQIRYHHGRELAGAKIEDDSLAYITYFADNISAAVDRRDIEDGEKGWDRQTPLGSVFNILNGNSEKKKYRPVMLDINNVTSASDTEYPYSETFYGQVKDNIKDSLKQLTIDDSYVNSLLEILEANLSFVPSSTSKEQLADISLYDHVKLTAAFAICILRYMEANGITNYKDELFKKGVSDRFYDKKVFLMYGIDMSGIQDFIYTITAAGALKTLRAKSFYLEMFMEHLVDELFTELGLCRTNLMYTGGGHAYMILPNTKETKEKISQFEKNTNKWLMDKFKTELYIATGMCECSSNDFNNEPAGSYKHIFDTVSLMISEKKMRRYDADDIRWLNMAAVPDGSRECKICHRTDRLDKDNMCDVCSAFVNGSDEIVRAKFFTILKRRPEERISLPLTNDSYLVFDDKEDLVNTMKNEEGYTRSYVKNELYSGYNISTKLWVGDYKKEDTFTALVDSAKGIRRLGVLRADVDNLGSTFVEGLKSEKYGDRFVTISRTSTLSRKISLFFKQYINVILNNGEFYLYKKEDDDTKRNAMIVYSGGDDVFIIGSWDDIIGLAVDLRNNLKEYAQGTLTISAGIGIFPDKTPVNYMARVTGKLEDAAKGRQIDSKTVKDGICLFDKSQVFGWEEFIDEVYGEKLELLERYLNLNPEKGKNFIYNLLELIRKSDEKINIARFAYTLARIEPQADAELKVKEIYQEFRIKIYEWYKNDNGKDRQQLITAIYIYVYLTRKDER